MELHSNKTMLSLLSEWQYYSPAAKAWIIFKISMKKQETMPGYRRIILVTIALLLAGGLTWAVWHSPLWGFVLGVIVGILVDRLLNRLGW